MRILRYSLIFAMIIGFFSCDNEVDLNGEYQEMPSVFALLNPAEDTQFVRVGRVFLKDGVSAIDLTRDPNEIYFDSLDVDLIDAANGNVMDLRKKYVNKPPGTFDNSLNPIYYLDSSLEANKTYNLRITRPNGEVTTSSTTLIPDPNLTNPRYNRVEMTRKLSLVSTSGIIGDYNFEFSLPKEVAKIKASFFLKYYTLNNGQKEYHLLEIPIGSYTNRNLEDIDDAAIFFPGERFFETIAKKITDVSVDKFTDLQDNLVFVIYSADEDYAFYQELNGPIDGIAQVRPEFTNIENGTGLFASRSTITFAGKMGDPTRNELSDGPVTGHLNFRK